jgi:hypothetical protein
MEILSDRTRAADDRHRCLSSAKPTAPGIPPLSSSIPKDT